MYLEYLLVDKASRGLNNLNKLKEYKAIFILIALLLLGCFYWYELRPNQIRKKCYEEAIVSAQNEDKIRLGAFLEYNEDFKYSSKYRAWKIAIEKGFYDIEDFDRHYADCLKAKGLDK